jgi:hypothetical protein
MENYSDDKRNITAAERIKLLNLSSMPSCPGNQVLKSFTLLRRLNHEELKSPIRLETAMIQPDSTGISNTGVKKIWNPKARTTALETPPTAPSMVFAGLIAGASL